MCNNYVKFQLNRFSRLALHREHTDIHFYIYRLERSDWLLLSPNWQLIGTPFDHLSPYFITLIILHAEWRKIINGLFNKRTSRMKNVPTLRSTSRLLETNQGGYARPYKSGYGEISVCASLNGGEKWKINMLSLPYILRRWMRQSGTPLLVRRTLGTTDSSEREIFILKTDRHEWSISWKPNFV